MPTLTIIESNGTRAQDRRRGRQVGHAGGHRRDGARHHGRLRRRLQLRHLPLLCRRGWAAVLPEPTAAEREMLECALDPQDNSRLSCQIRITPHTEGWCSACPSRRSDLSHEDTSMTATSDDCEAPTYDGPIFDGDTHLYETPDAFSRYLPEKFKKDWSYQWKVGDDGEYALYVGRQKVEISAGYYSEDGRVPPPGKLHEWLRAQKEGKENVDMRVPMTPDMVSREARLAKMDEFGVEGCFLYCGNMVATISYLNEPKAAAAVMHAYNRWMLDDWGFNYQDRIYSAPLVSLDDLDAACTEAEVGDQERHAAVPDADGSVRRQAAGTPGFRSVLVPAQ